MVALKLVRKKLKKLKNSKLQTKTLGHIQILSRKINYIKRLSIESLFELK